MNSLAISILVTLVVIASANSLGAKDLPYDHYPSEFEKLTASDWPKMQETLEKVVSLERIDAMDDSLRLNATYTIARISRIPWGIEKKQEVVHYLLEFAKTLLDRPDIQQVVGKEPDKQEDRSYPHMSPGWIGHLPLRAIWSAGAIASSLPEEQTVDLWTLTLAHEHNYYAGVRHALLGALERQFADPAIPKVIDRLSKLKGDLSKAEAVEVERILLKHELFTIQDQARSWEHLWNKANPNGMNEVLTPDFQWKWYENIQSLRAVYDAADPATAFAIASSAPELPKKYVFLYSTVFLINAQLAAGDEVEPAFKKNVEASARAVLRELSKGELPAATGQYRDYLRDTLERWNGKAVSPPNILGEETDMKPALKDVEGSGVVSARPGDSATGQNGPALRAAVPAAPPTSTAPAGGPDGARPSDGLGLSRAEDRGESLSDRSFDQLMTILLESADRVERRKAAKALGDRSLDNSLGELTEPRRLLLEKYVEEHLITGVASKDGGERVEANEQIQRLWRPAAAVLIRHLDDPDLTIAEASAKNLILMRDENIIREIIEKAKVVQGQERALCVICLGKMTERRESRIPGRTCMSPEDSLAVADRIIRPFLLEIQQQGGEQMIMLVQRALQDLDRQAPAGVWVQTPPTTQKSDK